MAEAPRLFLLTPPLADPEAFAPLLRAAFDSVDVASLLLRSASRDAHDIKAMVRALAPIAQAKGAAVLIEGDERLAARLDLDGVHVSGAGEAFEAALAALKPHRIVGIGGLADRDAAMAAGERGADYLMFGGPENDDSHAAICDKATWWAEIFHGPCVAYARSPDLAGEVATTGAEFVALCDGIWDAPAAVGATLARVRDAVARETVA